jgi:NTP pyrophosphatase (non-canonical NTP hydrolase)
MTTRTQQTIIGMIIEERGRQDKKWGQQNHPHLKWFAILMEEVGEIANALLTARTSGPIITELIHVAAMCVAWLEYFDRTEGLK